MVSVEIKQLEAKIIAAQFIYNETGSIISKNNLESSLNQYYYLRDIGRIAFYGTR